VLAAAGSGERLGADRPKAFVRLGELPLLAESLRRLDESDWVDEIVVAAPPGWEEPAILLAEELGAGKASTVVTAVPGDVAVLLVHDAARPLVTDEVIERVLTPLGEGWDGAVPALPVADTLKRVRGDEVIETMARDDLVAVQTPQAFLADVLRRAARQGDMSASDCASMVEAAGGRIRTVPGDPRLLKVTTPDDLEVVARWL